MSRALFCFEVKVVLEDRQGYPITDKKRFLFERIMAACLELSFALFVARDHAGNLDEELLCLFLSSFRHRFF
jgi:hypothetical protein